MQSKFFATLTIVLLMVLVICCRRIEASADQDTDSEIEAPDGVLFNPNPIGGPLSAEMYEMHPQLAYLGQFNSKFWYIDRTNVNYADARANCSSMGMSIARIDYQNELNFLFDVTLSTDLPWVGAALPMHLGIFRWDGTVDEYPSNILFTSINTWALRFVRTVNGLSSLTPAAVTGARFALCILNLEQ